MANRRILAAAFILALTVPSAAAHEFWLEPMEPRVTERGALQADVRVGQNMVGTSYSYIPEWFKSFEIIENGVRRPVDSFIGDRPAVNEPATADGLAQIVYRSKPDFLTYKVLGKFVSFATKEGLDGALESHRARGLPDNGFAESYVRHAKALIAVGTGAGEDGLTGLSHELVAEDNPYLAPSGGPISIRLYFEGAPRAGALIKVFHRAPDGAVTIGRLRTDARGRIETGQAPGVYLISAVLLQVPPDDLAASHGVVWHTVWASLTFGRE
jgi:cobalt/nickel transport protein